jgi:hypothetical protein
LLTTCVEREAASDDVIQGDRRQHRRYGLRLKCKWKLLHRKRVVAAGVGTTLDVSSGGLLFEAGRHLSEGQVVELSINWPVLLHNVTPMQLVVRGRIVRHSNGMIAIRTVTHEFRTAGDHARAKVEVIFR